ncbi:MAG: hypothetical protein Q8R92_07840 [Deltaproteobacteria bacterium]|nr:hypothetical protein [Deltaproteobacteria bacterium]
MESILIGLAALGTGLVGLFAAVMLVLAARSVDEPAPLRAGTMDLAGTTASPRGLAAEDGALVAASISSLHRRLPSPASAMEAV